MNLFSFSSYSHNKCIISNHQAVMITCINTSITSQNWPATTLEVSPRLELLIFRAKSTNDFSSLKPLKMSRLRCEAISSHRRATLSIVSSWVIKGLVLSQLRVSSSSRPWYWLKRQICKMYYMLVWQDKLNYFGSLQLKTPSVLGQGWKNFCFIAFPIEEIRFALSMDISVHWKMFRKMNNI